MRHPLAHRSTRSSKSKASTIWLLALTAGCATPGEVSVSTQGDPSEIVKVESIAFQKKTDPEDDFALTYGESTMYLGVGRNAAFEAFQPPDKATEFSSLPAQFEEKYFGAFGWEAGGFAFGCITFEQTDTVSMLKSDAVVHAMYTKEDVTDEVVEAVVSQNTELYGAPTDSLPGSRIGYWFWHKPGRRLMVNTAVDAAGKKTLTVAVGDTQVMTLLGMSIDQAKKDKDLGIQRLNESSKP